MSLLGPTLQVARAAHTQGSMFNNAELLQVSFGSCAAAVRSPTSASRQLLAPQQPRVGPRRLWAQRCLKPCERRKRSPVGLWDGRRGQQRGGALPTAQWQELCHMSESAPASESAACCCASFYAHTSSLSSGRREVHAAAARRERGGQRPRRSGSPQVSDPAPQAGQQPLNVGHHACWVCFIIGWSKCRSALGFQHARNRGRAWDGPTLQELSWTQKRVQQRRPGRRRLPARPLTAGPVS